MKFEQLLADYRQKKSLFYREPWTEYCQPFKIAGPVYYVGDRQVCVHLVDTGDGLVLMDSGFPHTAFMLFDSIWRMGFKPEDVKAIIHSHGHYDHFGASEIFRKLYGTKLYISRADAEMLKKCPQASCKEFCAELAPMLQVPEFDGLLEDGDSLKIGKITFRTMLYPGHTPGNMGIFFEAEDEGKMLRFGSFGGAGLGSARRCSLQKFGLDEKLSREIFASIEKAEKEKVDVMLGNHPYNNKTLEKRQLQLAEGGNPFVDEAMWPDFLKRTRASFEKMLAEEEND